MVVGLTHPGHGKSRAMRGSVRSSVSTGPSGAGGLSRRFVRVVLLNREQLDIPVEAKSKAREVFNQVCSKLGLREVEYFGLAQFTDGEHHFIDLDTKIQKVNPKGWKSHNQADGSPVITFYFRVQFYVDHVMVLRERITRQLYYLQLKDNLLHFNQLCTEEKCFLLAGYALQADHGTYNSSMEENQYFDPREYFPAWVINKRGDDYIRKSMPSFHKDLGNLSRVEAQMRFIKDISAPPTSHNLHFYQLKKRKADPMGTAWLGICPKGIEIYDTLNNFKTVLFTFLWPEIGKLYYEKKKFEIRNQLNQKYPFYTGSDDRSKYLLWLCRLTHMFQMTLQPKMAEIKHLEEVDKRQFKESYIYSDVNDAREHENTRKKVLSSFHKANGLTPTTSSVTLDQRVSLYSNTSSNTTSGIVSDKMYSFDESEDDRSMREIMIDSPPNPGVGSFRNQSLNTSSMLSASFQTPLASSLSDSSFRSAKESLTSFQSPMLKSTPINSASNLPQGTPTGSVGSGSQHALFTSSPGNTSKRASVSRSSSNTSQRSARLTISPVALAESTPIKPVANLVPAEVQVVTERGPAIQIQRGQPAHFSHMPLEPIIQQVASPMQVAPVASLPRPTDPLAPQNPDLVPLQTLPVPADVQIQRVNMAPIMTVSSVRLQNNTTPSLLTAPANPNQVLPSATNKNIMSPSHPGYVNYKPPQTSVLSVPKPGVTMVTAAVPTEYSHTAAPQIATVPNLNATVTQSGYSGSYYGLAGHPPMLPAVAQPMIASGQPLQFVQPSQTIPVPRPLNVVVDVHPPPPPPTSLAVLAPTTPPPSNSVESSIYGTPVYQPFNNSYAPAIFRDSSPGDDSPPAYQPPPPPTSLPINQPLVQSTVNEVPSYQLSVPATFKPQVHPVTTYQQQPAVTNYTAPVTTPSYQAVADAMSYQPIASNAYEGAKPKTTLPSYQETQPFPSSPPADENISSKTTAVSTSPTSTSGKSLQLPESKQVRHNSWGQYEKIHGDNTRRARNRRHKTCPVHDIKPDVVEELRGLTNKNLSLPLLTALFNDTSLQTCEKDCNCHDSAHKDELTDAKLKRLSMNLSPNNTLLNEPGTMVRPMSWHSDTFNLDQLSVFHTLNIDEGRKDPDYQNLPPVLNGGNSSPGSLNNTSHMINGVGHSSTASLPGNLPALSMVPRKISSGGHSPNSTETLHQHATLGIA